MFGYRLSPINRILLLKNKKGGNHKVFMYAFNHRTPGNPWPEWAGVALHGYEIDHVFGVPRRPDRATFGNYRDEDIKLSDRMIIFWTNFAKRGCVTKMSRR